MRSTLSYRRSVYDNIKAHPELPVELSQMTFPRIKEQYQTEIIQHVSDYRTAIRVRLPPLRNKVHSLDEIRGSKIVTQMSCVKNEPSFYIDSHQLHE